MAAIRVVVVDEQQAGRDRLRLIVDGHPDMTVVGEAADRTGAVAAALHLRPDVLLTEVELPDLDGGPARVVRVRDVLLAAAAGSPGGHDPRPAGPGATLTAREREVVRNVALGCRNADIGRALFITAGTVKTHLANAQAKLGARNRLGVAAWAWSVGLVGAGDAAAARGRPGCG